MDILPKNTAVVLLVLVASALAGCASMSSEEVAEAQERELRIIQEFHEKVVIPMTARPSGNAGETAWVAYETRMASFQGTIPQLMPNTLGNVLGYAQHSDEMKLRWATLGSDWLQFAVREWRRGDYGGTSYTLKADRGSTISGVKAFGPKSIYSTGEGANIAQDDSQTMRDAEGNTQTRSTTRPNIQPQLDQSAAEGDAGSNTINSQGLGVEAGI